MVTPSIPTAPMKGLGTDAYSAANSTILKQNVEAALKEGIQSLFMFGDGEFGDDMANNFAKAISGPLCDAIDDYVTNMIKSQNIIITPAALVSPVGPVTGAMTTMTDIQIM